MNEISRFFLFFLSLVFSSVLLAQRPLPVVFRGASITAGYGASRSLGSRIRAHLSVQREVEQIASVRTLLALDYFFVTNFPQLQRGTPAEFRARVQTLLREWTGEFDLVVVGLLPVAAGQTEALRAFLATEKGAPFRGAFQVLSRCCAARASIFNEMLRAEAARNPRIVIFDWVTAITAYQRNPQLRPSPAEIYADILHLNDRGQIMLFNLALRPLLGRIWNVALTPMALN